MRRRNREKAQAQPGLEMIQLVGFRVRDEDFAFPIQDVREVDKMQAVTQVPHAPEAVVGMVDVRGEVIPVVSLRALFGMGADSPGPKSRIIFVESPSAGGGGKRTVGCIVDALSRVIRVPKPSLSEVPAELIGVHRSFLEAVARMDGRLIMILRAASLLPANGKEESS